MKILLLILFISLEALALPESIYFENYCSVFSFKGNLVSSFPGKFCQFLPDGRYITAVDRNITMMSADDTVVWKLPLLVHHQMNLSNDGKRVLALVTENRKSDGGRMRVDKFAVISVEGKILHEADVSQLMKGILPLEIIALTDENKKRTDADVEESHFNSIYEIPKNSSKLPFLKEGNILVNSLRLGACVLTPDLKKVLDCRRFPESNSHTVHDVKITSEGKYLYFNNEVTAKSELKSSSVDELDPETNKITFRFAANPASMFYSPICGSVQILKTGQLFISHMQNGVYIVNRKTRKVDEFFPSFNLEKMIWITQRYRAIELDAFFNARKKK